MKGYGHQREARLPQVLYGLDQSKFEPIVKHSMQVIECTRCKARLECRAPIPGVGNYGAKILLLGRNPGENEDKLGLPFVGQGGQLLDRWIEKAGLNRSDLFITNMVKCFTTANRKPEPDEIGACTHWFQRELNLVQPKLVIVFGEQAVTFVVGFWQNSRLKLHVRMWGEQKFYVIAVVHPGAPLHNSRMMKDFMDDAYFVKAQMNVEELRIALL